MSEHEDQVTRADAEVTVIETVDGGVDMEAGSADTAEAVGDSDVLVVVAKDEATEDEVAEEAAEDLPAADGVAEDDGAEADAEAADDSVPAADRIMVDPRGVRFGAAVTVVVLAAVLLTIPSIASVVLLVVQAIVFGAAALFGLKAHPYGWVFRRSVAPRLGPPTELEDEAPPRFAQQVGLLFVLAALVALALGFAPAAQIATAFALAAAFLNAAFNFCLGCEIYLLFHRVRTRKA